MPPPLSIRRELGVTILEISGRLTMGGAVADLADAIKGAIEAGEKNFLVDLAGVTYIDSSGIGQLTGGLKDVTAAGGSLRLLNVNARATGLLKLTQVYTLFRIYREKAAALASFDTAN